MNHEPPTTNQSGVATILAIGITALLLCLAITYVTTSIVEKKAATNYQSMIAARIAAQTAFNRAVAQMKDASTDIQESFNEIVSHNSKIIVQSGDFNDYEYLANKLTTVINGDTYYSLPSSYPYSSATDTSNPIDMTDSSAVSWIYLRVNQTDTGQIIGRMAYVVIPDKGKIDPWSVIDSGVNAGSYGKPPPSELNYSGINKYTSVDVAGNYVIGRPGRDLTELSLASLEHDGSDTFSSTYTQEMSVKDCSPAGLVEPGTSGDWVDFEQIFYKLGIPANDDTTRNYFKKVFYVNAQPDPEAFWVDISGDSIREPSELYHRFNLTRTDWNNVTVDSFLSSGGTKLQYSLVGESNYLPWLKNWNDKGDFSLTDSARDQIIANLITYCKTDTNALTDSPVAPSYFGLERCPYINEARIQIPITISRADTPTPSSNYVWTITMGNPTISIETVDMYGVVLSGSALPTAIINLNLSYYIGESDFEDIRSVTITDSPLDVGYTPKGYASTNGLTSGYYYTVNKTIVKSNNLDIKIYLNSFKIRLQSRDAVPKMYDFSYLHTDALSPVIMQAYSGNASSGYPTNFYIDYQTRDPRQNLLTTDWNRSSGTSSTIGTPGAVNSNYPTTFTGADTDPEPDGTAPWNLSTAYIRKGPMKSPWELGFIHRAKAFQTLNLKKYNSLSSNEYGFGPNSGGGPYSDGDANILDQIKMTSNTTTLGKINLNSDNKSVLRALFDNICVGCNIKENGDVDTGGATRITVTQADSPIAYDVTVANGSAGTSATSAPFLTRAQIVNSIPYLSVDDASKLILFRNTKAKQDELIGKFINLTKAESPDQYIVIAVGEAIRDVGGTQFDREGNSIPLTTTGFYEHNADDVLASQKILAIIKRKIDPVTSKFNKFYILRMMYLTD